MAATAPTSGLRRDAARNRARLLEAARKTFRGKGIEAPLEEVARLAGVGIATLYRRFPTREALVEALFEDKWLEYVAAAEQALEANDPWQGFRSYIERICTMQAEDRGFTDVLTTTFPSAKAVEASREQARRKAVEVIRRAQDAGALRPDFVIEDVPFILIANGAYLEATRGIAPDAWKRYVALLLDALRSDRAGPLPPPPTRPQIDEAMRAVSRIRRRD
jgi:AcrR family transcriptional regulator